MSQNPIQTWSLKGSHLFDFLHKTIFFLSIFLVDFLHGWGGLMFKNAAKCDTPGPLYRTELVE